MAVAVEGGGGSRQQLAVAVTQSHAAACAGAQLQQQRAVTVKGFQPKVSNNKQHAQRPQAVPRFSEQQEQPQATLEHTYRYTRAYTCHCEVASFLKLKSSIA